MVSLCPPLDGSAETETTMLSFTSTTFTSGHTTHDAICVSWDDVAALLGRDHEGTAEDDTKLVDALREAGAPTWAASASGAIDESGWYLLGPAGPTCGS